MPFWLTLMFPGLSGWFEGQATPQRAASHILLIPPGQRAPGLFGFIFVPKHFGALSRQPLGRTGGPALCQAPLSSPHCWGGLALPPCPRKPFLPSPNMQIPTIELQVAAPPVCPAWFLLQRESPSSPSAPTGSHAKDSLLVATFTY